jgi:nitrate reductase gamma subunit
MEAWIAFGQGPLFRFAFALMVLGLLRVLVLTIVNVAGAYRRSADRMVRWGELGRQTLGWMVPLGRLWRKRPVYSAVSVLFHAGLISVPLSLEAHILLWKRATGLAWPAMPQQAANWLALAVLATGAGLFLGRALDAGVRAISRRQDYLWPLLLIVPFATGWLCSNAALGPRAYQALMLAHVYSGDLILLLIPFTKIAHCVLAPLSQFVTAIAWKFPAGAGDRVAATLGYADRPSWVEKARLARREVEFR